MTSRLPAGNTTSRLRNRCRSRRATVLRTTAPPTDRPTTRPTRAGAEGAVASAADCVNRCSTSAPRLTRRPRDTVARKSSGRRRRTAGGSMTGRSLRQTAWRDPCRVAPRRWHDRPGSASAGGIRAYGPAVGCSAGRCACSREDSEVRTAAGPDTCRGAAAARRAPTATALQPADRTKDDVPRHQCGSRPEVIDDSTVRGSSGPVKRSRGDTPWGRRAPCGHRLVGTSAALLASRSRRFFSTVSGWRPASTPGGPMVRPLPYTGCG